ncbi:hypothetical protein JCGZ_06740 [Jatropha curcas]|uniref:Uncharacterized protein n=1 Tax=Jatropha curcas TaxID=180498 RepID=A0A067KM36_JATCU|nr:hypothetical protein JCGZ_06740 [Jatropha curcas]
MRQDFTLLAADVKGGHIIVSGTGTVGSNRSRIVTGTDGNRNWFEPESELEIFGSVSVLDLRNCKPAVPQNRSKPDWNLRFSDRLEPAGGWGGGFIKRQRPPSSLFSSFLLLLRSQRRPAVCSTVPSRLTPPSLLRCSAGRQRIPSPRRSRSSVQENYTTARECLVSSQAESEAESRIDEASQFYCDSALTLLQPAQDHSAEEFTALRARVDEQERQLAELRAHIMRLSVSPVLQPLLSPDPDAADDTLVTPAGTTAHPAGTPPGDSTLDRADNQQRRFDFGPF